MITAKGQLIDLTYMCGQSAPKPVQKPKHEVTNDDLCSLAESRRASAQNQFQHDEAMKDLAVCRYKLPQ